MDDLTIPNDMLDGVEEALNDAGKLRYIRVFTRISLDPKNPGAGQPKIHDDYPVQTLFYDFEDADVNGTTVMASDRLCLVSIKGLKFSIDTSMRVIDGDRTFNIAKVSSPEATGVPVVSILHIRG